jgi:hypothetical protein
VPYYSDVDFEALVALLRDLRPWDRRAVLRDGLGRWARGEADTGVCDEVAREIGRIGTDPSYPHWTDSAVAHVTMEMLHNVAAGHQAWELGGSLLAARRIPRSTRYYNRAEGMSYVYRRVARERDLRELVAGGRSLAAARQWLLRHRGRHYWDAPPPQSRGSG